MHGARLYSSPSDLYSRPVTVVGLVGHTRAMVTAEQVREVALGLPRAYEAWVRDRRKFRVGRIVFLAFSRDEQTIGFGYPRDARASLVAAEPEKFFLPGASDMRYQWVCAWLAALEEDEMRELIIDAWAMCVPKKLVAEVLGSEGR
jgi:hypothetical protein